MSAVFVIAEAGVNHQGRLDHALSLIGYAAAAGCDAVKFQAYTPWVLAPKNYETQAVLKGLALTKSELLMCAAECRRVNVEFLVTPMDSSWLAEVVAMGVKRIKIGSAQAGRGPFTDAVIATKLPVIVSNGLAVPNSFNDMMDDFENAGTPTTVLSCISKYPTPDTMIHLHELDRLRGCYPWAKIGFSCHARSMWPSIAAVYAGATVVEKHIALPGTTGPDISSSLFVDELPAWVREIRVAEKGRA